MATRYAVGLCIVFIIRTHILLAEDTSENIVQKSSDINSENTRPNPQNLTNISNANADTNNIQNINETISVVYIYPSLKNGRATKNIPVADASIYEERTTPVYAIYPARVDDWTPRDDENDTGANAIEATGAEGRDDSPSENVPKIRENVPEIRENVPKIRENVPKKATVYFTEQNETAGVNVENDEQPNSDIIVGKRVSAVNSPAKLGENYYPKDFYRFPSRSNKVSDAQGDKVNAKNSALRARLSHLSHIRQKTKNVKGIPSVKRRLAGQNPTKIADHNTHKHTSNTSNGDKIKDIKEKPQYILDSGVEPIITNDMKLKEGNVFESIRINTAIKVTKTHSDYKGIIKGNGLGKRNHSQTWFENNEPTHTKVINLKVIADGRNNASMSFESLENEPAENQTRGPLDNISMIPFTLEDAVTPPGMHEFNERPKRNNLWDYLTKGNSQQYAGIYSYGTPYQMYQPQNTRNIKSISVRPAYDAKRVDRILWVQKLPEDISNIPIVGDIPKSLAPTFQREEIYKSQLELPKV